MYAQNLVKRHRFLLMILGGKRKRLWTKASIPWSSCSEGRDCKPVWFCSGLRGTLLGRNKVYYREVIKYANKVYSVVKFNKYSKIPLLRPPKIRTNSPLKSIFKKCQSFFLCVFCTQCFLERDHLWDCSKVVLKTTLKQSQRWSYYRNFTVYAK